VAAASIHSYKLGFYWRENNRIYATFWIPPDYVVGNIIPKTLQVHIDEGSWGWYYSWEVKGWKKQ
jgi:hypothetical protein